MPGWDAMVRTDARASGASPNQCSVGFSTTHLDYTHTLPNQCSVRFSTNVAEPMFGEFAHRDGIRSLAEPMFGEALDRPHVDRDLSTHVRLPGHPPDVAGSLIVAVLHGHVVVLLVESVPVTLKRTGAEDAKRRLSNGSGRGKLRGRDGEVGGNSTDVCGKTCTNPNGV